MCARPTPCVQGGPSESYTGYYKLAEIINFKCQILMDQHDRPYGDLQFELGRWLIRVYVGSIKQASGYVADLRSAAESRRGRTDR